MAIVGECNTVAGEGSCRVMADAVVDLPEYIGPLPLPKDLALGISADLDIFILGSWRARVNYNSVLDGIPLGMDMGMVLPLDFGLLKIGLTPLDGRYNWYGHASGPAGFGPGQGEAVAWCLPSAVIDYMPWLISCHEESIDHHIGKFGFAISLHECWNTFSTPITLADDVKQFADLLNFSGIYGQVEAAYRWDDAAQQWVSVLDTYEINPLEGFYWKMNSDAVVLLKVSNDDHMETRDLNPGFCLIGPNPPFPDPAILVEDAVSSIEGPPGEGYAFIASPPVGSTQASWVWSGTPGIPDCPCMLSGLAYWAYMEGADTLAGQGFTPIRTLYPVINNPCS
jgi:hypothetical protein